MKKDRRDFLKKAFGVAGTFALSGWEAMAQHLPHEAVFNYTDDFWQGIRNAYTTSSNLINLNNGGVSPQPKVVQEAFEHYNRFSNEAPSYTMWRILDKGREDVRRDLAQLAGVDSATISICRNSTEALDTIIFGMNLKKGDEVIVTNYDYPNMRSAWMQREMRDGIKLKWISIPLAMENDEELVKLFTDAFSSKTKVVHITHMINWTGQVLPAKKITEAAHQNGVEVILDAAHSFAHIPCNLKDIGCDYAGTSLHKWLCAPFGTGMMYMKKEKIANHWPTFPSHEPRSADIKKFENLGTRSFPSEMAIGKAIDFHVMIGSERKRDRLFELKKYWTDQVKDLPGIKFFSPLSKDFSGAICTVGFTGVKPSELESFLFNNFSIHTVSIEWENVSGIRVTPNVYTSLGDLDKLVEGLTSFAKSLKK